MRESEANASPKALDLTRIGFSTAELSTPVGRMRAFTGGNGAPLIMLHGIGGGASSYYYARLAPLLAGRYRVIAPDFVGWGDSDHPTRFVEFSDYVEQIRALLEYTGPPVAIVAQSLAAGFAIAALKGCSPTLETRFVLLVPTGGRDFGKDAFDPLFAWTLSLLARWKGVNMALYRRYFHRRSAYSFWFERRGFLDPAKVPADLIDAGFRSGTMPNAAYAALPFVGGSLRFDIAPLLQSLNQPALMVWGEQEAQIKPAIRARLATLNPRIRVATIPGARTNFESEAPNVTADLILSFLQEDAQ